MLGGSAKYLAALGQQVRPWCPGGKIRNLLIVHIELTAVEQVPHRNFVSRGHFTANLLQNERVISYLVTLAAPIERYRLTKLCLPRGIVSHNVDEITLKREYAYAREIRKI